MQTEMMSPVKNQAKNGLAFEVILDVPKGTTPAKLTPQNTPNRQLTQEDIIIKLQRAEERRQSLEMAKLSMISEKNQKIEEAAKIREEQNLNFSKQTEQKLISKLEASKENRNTLKMNLMEKLKKTDTKIAQIKEIASSTADVLEEKIINKLLAAEENRLANISALTERLKEHEKHVEEVRNATMGGKDEELEEKIILKLQNALDNREDHLDKIKEKMREHAKRIDEVREKARLQSPNSSSCFEQN
ncbi:trichohyalin-like isoform X1 [Brachionus plicatilis]|uniref:Trichohyalin-like isoform X1 n=1 Tax=Brachionus plicatilis TaxID=10195 RepID=A0A3M7P3B1_BRAPC|nr:trichohyalin-like isoform X1 [Brachionus plicatilis]